VYILKYSMRTCKREMLNDFDDGYDFKMTVKQPNVFIPWLKATPEEYGDATTWEYNIPQLPESEAAEAEGEDAWDDFVFSTPA
jgi:hypothetical protein